MATVRRVVAPNPSPFTGPGTNTWILGDGPALIVIDPGPDDEDHLTALRRAVGAHAVGVVLVTHGHADHLAFWMPDDRVLFTGDLVLGRGSSMVTYPEGDVAAYLRSLERVAALRPRILFPGHWDPVVEAEARIADYREHRLARERQVVGELETRGPGTAPELTERVYAAELAGLEEREQLLRAAEMTLRAHLHKLVEEGRVTERDERFALAAEPGGA